MSAVIEKLTPGMKKAFVIESSGNIMLPAMRLMYGAFFTTVFPSKRERDPKKKRWGGTGLIPGVASVKALEDAINEIVGENLTEAKRKPAPDGTLPYNFPILKTAKIASLASYADEYPLCVRLGTREFDNNGKRRPAPQVVNPKGLELTEEHEADEVYNGRWFRASVNPYWYDAQDGKPGVSLGLVNIQLLFNDDPLAGGKAKASAEFEAVDIDEDEDVNEGAYE